MSASQKRAPLPRAKNLGVPPTERNARTGELTPPGVTASIADPGYIGGSDWGGASIDEARGLALLPSNHVSNYIKLVPRSDPRARNLKAASVNELGGLAPQEGTPYAADIHPFLSPLKVPCQAPPYGRLNAIDLHTGKMVWSRPLGNARDLGPNRTASHLPLTIGTTTTGGALTTASGLVFVAAASDHAFRVFDSTSGKLLFVTDLPGWGASTPITYRSARSGRQFVVISSEALPHGASFNGALTAFVLP